VIVLRATRKVLKSLVVSASDADISDTALGDWYVNRVVVDRQPLLLLVSSASLLSIVTYARDVKSLPDRLAQAVGSRLQRLGVHDDVIAAEIQRMETVRVGSTCDRSVVGQMVDFAKTIPCVLPIDGWAAPDLLRVEDLLGETPCRVSGSFSQTIWPARDAVQLLGERWGLPCGQA
jgi:hypothetical protein